MYQDALLVVLISFGTAMFSEAISWVLVYRQDAYKRLKSLLDLKSKKLEKKKDEATSVGNEKQKRKVDRFEEQIKLLNRDMTMIKFKSMIAQAVIFIGLLGSLNSWFAGRIVARLPFEPFGFLQGMTHRGLEGSDMTECSFIFLYVLSSMFLRQGLQKVLGFAPSRAANQMANPFMPKMPQ
eukprot:Colp12_sorted_trinity150504_noHs@14575